MVADGVERQVFLVNEQRAFFRNAMGVKQGLDLPEHATLPDAAHPREHLDHRLADPRLDSGVVEVSSVEESLRHSTKVSFVIECVKNCGFSCFVVEEAPCYAPVSRFTYFW